MIYIWLVTLQYVVSLINQDLWKFMYSQQLMRNVDVIFLLEFLYFNTTFNYISAISWRPVLVAEEAGVTGEIHRPWASNC